MSWLSSSKELKYYWALLGYLVLNSDLKSLALKVNSGFRMWIVGLYCVFVEVDTFDVLFSKFIGSSLKLYALHLFSLLIMRFLLIVKFWRDKSLDWTIFELENVVSK